MVRRTRTELTCVNRARYGLGIFTDNAHAYVVQSGYGRDDYIASAVTEETCNQCAPPEL
jgi:hypothetical protein